MFEATKDFIAALRAADKAVSVYMRPAEHGDTDTRHLVTIRITASVETKAPAGFITDTAGAFAEATATFNFRTREPVADGYRIASFVTLYPNSGQWRALSLILRPGDLLTFTAFDNTSENLKSRDLHADTLFVQIMRKGKIILDMFPVEYSAGCPDNSARSLKR